MWPHLTGRQENLVVSFTSRRRLKILLGFIIGTTSPSPRKRFHLILSTVRLFLRMQFRLPYKTFLWRTNLRRPKFWRSENMAKLNKNRHISDVTENKGIFHHFVFGHKGNSKFSKNW